MNFKLLPTTDSYHVIWMTISILFILIASLVFVELFSLPLFYVLILIILVYVLIVGWLLCSSLRKQMVIQKKLEALNKDMGTTQDKMTLASADKNEFLSFATHQLRSPLTSLKWGLNAVEGAVENIPETLKIVKQMRDIAQNMVETVNDLLDISKIEQGGLVLTKEPVDLVELLDHLSEEYRMTAESKQLSLLFKTDLPVAIISGDKTKLRQVFVNIIDNAIKYTESGLITVNLSYDAERNNFIASVIDTGPGISAEELENLFEKFARGKAGKASSAGSGLGLYLGKKIVELHNGDILVTSEGISKGSTFSVILPKNI